MRQTNEEMLAGAPFSKLIVKLCVPTVVIMMVMVVYNMADTYFIGQTGDPLKIAAVSLCGPLFSVLSGLGTLFGSGGCTVISLAFGKKEYDKIRSVTSFCFYGSLALGAVFAAVMLAGLRQAALLIGSDADTIAYTCGYLRVIAIGAPVILFTNVFNNLIRADGAAQQSMIANGIGTLVNIVLDPVCILGLGLGVEGAALATVLGNLCSGIYLVWYVLKKQRAFSFRPGDFSLRREVALPVVTLGLPLAFGTILMSVSHVFMNHILAGYGAIAVAANGVAGKAGMLITMIAMGICMGMQPAISYSCGAGAYGRMHGVIKNTAILTVVTGTALTAACFVARNQIVAAFIDNQEVIALGQQMVCASLIMGPFFGLYQLCTTFLQSTGKASFATFVALLDKGLVYLPLLFALNALFGLQGVIYTAAVTNVLSLAVGAALCLCWNRRLTGQGEAAPAAAG